MKHLLTVEKGAALPRIFPQPGGGQDRQTERLARRVCGAEREKGAAGCQFRLTVAMPDAVVAALRLLGTARKVPIRRPEGACAANPSTTMGSRRGLGSSRTRR